MENVWIQVLNMSLTASWVIVAVLVLRLLLLRAPKICVYALWGVVLWRLLCPFSWESSLSLVPVEPQAISPQIGYMPRPTIDSGLAAVDQAVGAVLPAATPMTSVNPLQVYLFVGAWLWFIGAAILLLWGLGSLWRLKRQLRDAQPSGENCYVLAGLPTPFVLGMVRPRIYLPTGLSEEERAYILLHEQTHIRRKDYLVKGLAYLALCLHWFNPLVWLSFYLLGKDMEMACDEYVLRQMGTDIKKAYSTSLLSLAAGRSSWRMAPLAFGESAIKSRIKHILQYKKPTLWLSILAILAIIIAMVGLSCNQKQTEPDLSFTNPENLISTVVELQRVQINPYQWNSYVYVNGSEIAWWLDNTQWQPLQSSPKDLPPITYGLEKLQGEGSFCEIHLFADNQTLAEVCYEESRRYYTIDGEAYSQLEEIIRQNAGGQWDKVVRLSGRIEELLAEIESSPQLSSAPSDYIQAHPDAYEELLSYGETTLLYGFDAFERQEQTEGLRGHLLAILCRELAADEEQTDFAADTGQAWYDAFKAQTLEQAANGSLEDMEKYQPAAYLLYSYLNERDNTLLTEILLPDYQYSGDDELERLVYEALAAMDSHRQVGFAVYAAQIFGDYTEEDRLKIFATCYSGTYRLFGKEVREDGGSIVPMALTYQKNAAGAYELLECQMAMDGSYFVPSIRDFCTMPVSGKTIPLLADKIIDGYSKFNTLNHLQREHLQEHLRLYEQLGVSLTTSYDDTVTPLT